MLIRIVILIFLTATATFALEPNEILIITNSDVKVSRPIAEYYCLSRGTPEENIVALSLGDLASDTISRSKYDKLLAGPVRKMLKSETFSGKIKCILTIYGVPIKIAGTGPMSGKDAQLQSLQIIANEKGDDLRKVVEQLQLLGRIELLSEETKDKSVKNLLDKLEQIVDSALKRIEYLPTDSERKAHYKQWIQCYSRLYGPDAAQRKARSNLNLTFSISPQDGDNIEGYIKLLQHAEQDNWDIEEKVSKGYYEILYKAKGLATVQKSLNADIDRLNGRETNASVDSELSMVLFEDYELYRWKKNELKDPFLRLSTKTIMVSRLDGPGANIARELIDKAIAAETAGVKGTAYFDSRGRTEKERFSFGYYDRSIIAAAEMIRRRTSMPVVQEKTDKLFQPGQCPQTALYCGWYSLKNYIDAFDFVTGAVGFHIASFEAIDLRDPLSKQWCPAMLTDGITATFGAVAEPYLQSFPEPKLFFEELLNGRCLVEAFYRTKPFNSWQLVLIGDPLYRLNIK